jgi:hypothetical protein
MCDVRGGRTIAMQDPAAAVTSAVKWTDRNGASMTVAQANNVAATAVNEVEVVAVGVIAVIEVANRIKSTASTTRVYGAKKNDARKLVAAATQGVGTVAAENVTSGHQRSLTHNVSSPTLSQNSNELRKSNHCG